MTAINPYTAVHIQSRTSTTPSSRINQHLQPSQHQHHTLSNQNHGHQLGAYTVTPSSGQLSLPRYHANALQPGSLPPLQHMRGTVISDLSFESGLSDDYALPPDAVSESTCMDASMPSLLMRQSYVDSPSKKIESLEKVSVLLIIFNVILFDR